MKSDEVASLGKVAFAAGARFLYTEKLDNVASSMYIFPNILGSLFAE
jgi:hypothetical protein